MSSLSVKVPAPQKLDRLPKASDESVLAQILGLVKHRQILALLVGRDMASRYRGSLLGRLWPLVHPLGQLIIYTFVFSVVLKIKFNASDSSSSFALYFMTALIPWSVFAESVSRSCTTILENPNLVSKVVFPTEILPLVNVLSALCTQSVAALLLLVCACLSLGKVEPTLVYLPIVVLPLVLLSAGVSWFLASLGVYIRDTKHFVSLALQAGMYATPILYPAKAVPQNYQWVLLLNPLSGIVEDFRRIILEGLAPDWNRLAVYSLVSCLVALAGLCFFLKTKKSFADVM